MIKKRVDKKIVRGIIIGLIVLGIFFVFNNLTGRTIGGTHPDYTVDDCDTLSSGGATYTLTADISGISGNCFVITADNVVLNLDSYSITGDGTGNGVYITSDSSTIANGTIDNFLDGIYIFAETEDISNNLFKNIQIENSVDKEVYIKTTGGFKSVGNVFLNVSFDSNKITFDDDSGSGDDMELIKKWYFETEVSDSSGYLSGATIDIYNESDDSIYSETTDADGSIGRKELIEYRMFGGASPTTTLNTPHIINVSKSGYATNTTIYDLNEKQNIFHSVVLNIPSPLTLTIISPKDRDEQNYSTNSITFNISANNNLVDCSFNISNSSWTSVVLMTENENISYVSSYFVSDGIYNINFTCEDEFASRVSKSVEILVESILGLIINSPKPSSEAIYTANSMEFNISFYENLDSCELSLNNGIKNYTMNQINENNFNYTNSSIKDGIYTAKFWCKDGSIINNSVVFKVDSSPDLSIESPENKTYSSSLIDFEVSSNPISIPVLEFSSCKFALNDQTTTYMMSVNGTKANYTDLDLSNGNYNVSFWCNYTNGNSDSEIMGFIVNAGSAGTPSNLNALADSLSQISLTWEDNTNDENGFEIERKIEGENYSGIINVSANTVVYSDTGLNSNTTYFYRLRAFNSSASYINYSSYSNEASAKTLIDGLDIGANTTLTNGSNISASGEGTGKEDIEISWVAYLQIFVVAIIILLCIVLVWFNKLKKEKKIGKSLSGEEGSSENSQGI